MLVRVPDEPGRDAGRPRCARDLRRTSSSTRGRTARREDQIGRDFDRAENYLSLVGLVIVILGGIAVSSVTRVFILQKIRSIAVLKCVGARSAQIIAVYILQVLALGLAGSLLGVAMARAAVAAIPLALGLVLDVASGRGALRRHLERRGAGHRRSACWSRCCFRSCRCCRCASSSRRCCCATRRHGAAATGSGSSRSSCVSLALVGADGLAGGVAQRRPRRVRRLCRAGVRAAAGGPRAGRGGRAARERRGRFRCATPCCTCRGPGNQTRVILLAVGLGAFFIVGVRSLQASLLEEFSIQSSDDSPDMFLLDIQRDRRTACARFSADPAHGAGPFQLIPVLRARVVGRRRPRDEPRRAFEDVRAARLARPRVHADLSRSPRSRTRRIIEGAFWNGAVGRARSVGRARDCASASGSTSATRCGSTSSAGSISAARHEHPRRRLARVAQRRLHVRVPAGRARSGAADLHRRRSRARRIRRRAAGSSTTSSSGFRTSR